jgi:polyisoprenoid-binding protein YceI
MGHGTAPIRTKLSKDSIAVALAAAGFLAVAPLYAAMETYKIDAAHSSVGFAVRHFTSKVPGRFNKIEGTITLDPKDLSKGSVNVTIDVASIDTANDDRDKHLKSPDFFDVEKHPKMTFQSMRVKPMGPNKAQIEGNLTIRGVTKPVTLEVEILGFGPGFGGYVGGFEARTKINRQDFGVAWNKAVEGGGLVLSNEVDIVINIEAGRQEPPKAAADTKG